ncbi:PD-(D/E)XK nuclease family protein [Microbacterium sp. 13-71-7]|uniref:RecB family exonuclease n=1 Tax=Microbacterium sp. 13-71-7 TaxID=1970399 RepID=UPI000BD4C3BD|nr:PD-(D/E)XK nuclease family protein [Microbacterium sp. 13-71-7]OZB85393.1 MAG: hypothetical protein B7X32_03630 [Microbacterium sp. 13-71-7]
MTDLSTYFAGFAFEGNRLRVQNEQALGRIRREQFSASSFNDVAQCPTMFAAKSVLPRVQSPLEPAPLGNVAHTAEENFYGLASAERTPEALTDFVRQAAREHADKHKAFKHPNLFKTVYDTVLPWAHGIFALEDPTTVDVHGTELKIEGVKLSNGVPFVGFVDRTDRIEGDPKRLIIRDYKFGKTVRPPSHHYSSQMRLYHDAIEVTLGISAEQATLLWPRQGKVVRADLSENAKRKTLVEFRREFDNMNAYADGGAFPTKPSNLCGWCPLANICPAARITSQNAIGHAAEMPSVEDLAIGLDDRAHSLLVGRLERTGQAVPVAARTATLRMNIPTEHTVEPSKEPAMSNAPVPFPANKWAAKAALRVADAAAVHLSIHQQPIDRGTVSALARVLASVVERSAREAFVGGFDWTFDSATEATTIVISTLRGNPAPFGQGTTAWTAWAEHLTALSVLKLQSGVYVMNEGNTEGAIAHLASTTVAVLPGAAEAA